MTTAINTAIQPFQLEVDSAGLDDLCRRLASTRWPDRETGTGWAQGIPLGFARELCRYWLEDYDWSATVKELNEVGQYLTTIDGLDIHFLHRRSPQPHARTLLLIHGWPSSVVEFLDVVAELVDPCDGAESFNVVCPSLPGHGFSQRPAETGWTVERIARAYAQLMERLGYQRYVAQGGDWGSFTAAALGHLDAGKVGGIHLSMPYAPQPDEQVELSERDQRALAAMKSFGQNRSGYAAIQSTRPQTLGYGLADSPAGQMAFIAERFYEWADHDDDLFSAISRRRIIDTVMMYWMTNTATSAARLFWESFYKTPPTTVSVPTGCSVGPRDAWLPRAWCERRFTDLRYWCDLDKGGHFPALEMPKQFAEQIRAFTRTLD